MEVPLGTMGVPWVIELHRGALGVPRRCTRGAMGVHPGAPEGAMGMHWGAMGMPQGCHGGAMGIHQGEAWMPWIGKNGKTKPLYSSLLGFGRHRW